MKEHPIVHAVIISFSVSPRRCTLGQQGKVGNTYKELHRMTVIKGLKDAECGDVWQATDHLISCEVQLLQYNLQKGALAKE